VAAGWLLSGVLVVAMLVPPAPAVGARWRIEPSANPNPSTNVLEDVSCVDSSVCVTLGESAVTTGSTPFVERRAGGTWSLQPISTPTLSPEPDSTAASVSCRARNDCTLVGVVSAFPIEHMPVASATFVQRWDGQTWHPESIPNATDGWALAAIDCRASLPCVAVGTMYAHSGPQPVVAQRVSGAWHEVSLGSTGGGTLGAISCSGPAFCLAIGSVTELWNGHRWRRVPHPLNSRPDGSAQVASLSCTSHQTCFAVGSWTSISGIRAVPLVERWSRGRWHVEATPRVPRAPSSGLGGISCQPDGSCVAVGSGGTPGAVLSSFPVIERRRHGRWSLQRPMQPPGSAFSWLGSVSCVASTCTAVGMEFPGQANGIPLIERYS
jgi:hypothetical protein